MNKITFAFKNMVGQKAGRIAEKWKYDSGNLLLSSPVVADIDNDGQKEIVFGTKNGVLMSIDVDGKLKWAYTVQDNLTDAELMFLDTESGHSISSSPNIEDINYDNQKEIVFGTEGGKLFVLDSKGKALWEFQAEGPIRGTPFIQKFSNKEVGIIFGSIDRHIYFLNAQGKLYWKYDSGSEIESCPSIIIGKQPLIVFGTNDGTIHAISIRGEPIWKFKTKAKIIAQAIYEKLTKTGSAVIIVGSTDGSMYCINEMGELIWEFKTGGAICSKASIGDIDLDGKNEIVFGSCDNCVYALDSTGKKIWSYETDFWVVASPIITDIDKDGKLEIVAGSYDHNIYVLDSQGSYMLDYVPGVSGIVGQTGTYGDAVTREPGKTQGKKIWQYQTDGIIVGCTVITDQNNIIVNTDSGKVNNLIHTKE